VRIWLSMYLTYVTYFIYEFLFYQWATEQLPYANLLLCASEYDRLLMLHVGIDGSVCIRKRRVPLALHYQSCLG